MHEQHVRLLIELPHWVLTPFDLPHTLKTWIQESIREGDQIFAFDIVARVEFNIDDGAIVDILFKEFVLDFPIDNDLDVIFPLHGS